MDKNKSSEAFDYLSKISLEIKEKDLVNNKPLIKKFLAELKDAKADNLALRDSLESTQNALEALKIDKAVLDAERAKNLPISILQDISATIFGAGIGSVLAGQSFGIYIMVPALLLYVVFRLITSKANTTRH